MARNAGFWPGSENETDVFTMDFGPNLGNATIQGTPVVVGTNCTATYIDKTPEGLVYYRVQNGTYAGTVTITATLSDGRVIPRQSEHRFL